ncbi:hypothetical protein BC962_3201 [Gillisia mitskevichiae]|uniref:Uncharacterized protein n=1 Tax=Gillisia mitskevichiae TaxID=270921 RepID=A0A495NVV1_9FLAO|nr:hypothetical protein [Gillisia mitskevichiae]RKS42534.1 hypothetical protein BC962_3201 [Gillisia mitskevichiae]
MRKIKSKFQIIEIGKFRFYSGILIGFGYGFIINILLRLLTKTKDITYAIVDGNWTKFLNSELTFYNSFLIGLIAASIGFCFTTYIWMSNIKVKNRKEKLKTQYAQINAIFTFGIIFLVLLRFYQIYFQFNFDGFSLNLEEEYGIFLYFLPIYMFMNNWNNISRIYIVKQPLLISTMILILFGLVLS